MHILFINTTFGYVGGVEQHIVLAADGLTKRGHRCSIAYLNPSGKELKEFSSHFSTVYPLASLSWDHILKQASPSVIYLHKWDAIEPILAAAGQNIPIIRYFHDHDIYCPRRHKYLSFTRRICTFKAGVACYFDLAFLEKKEGKVVHAPIQPKLQELKRNKALDCVVVGSSYMKNELIRNGFPSESIAIIPPSVADFDTMPTPPDHEGRLLYVGQLVRGKGVDTLLRALSLCTQNQTLSIIGAGNDEHYLQSLAKELNLQDRVRFPGWVGHHDLCRYYDDAEIVIVPSRWPEPFGMVGLEAMLRQRPVIACDVGGIGDWLQDGRNGLLVPVNDEHALAKAIDRLSMDISFAGKLGTEGRELVLSQFSFEAFITKLEHLLKERIG